MAPQYKRILFATALSDCSRFTLRHVVGLAAMTDAEIRVLHVVEKLSEDARLALMAFVQDSVQRDKAMSKRLELTRAHLDQRLEEFWADLPEAERAERRRIVAVDVVEGFAAEMILREAERRECDLIALGAHEQAMSHTFLGDVAKRVLRRATIPTLIVPYRRS